MKRLFTYFLLALLPMLNISGLKAQISPGRLSKAHAHLEGLSNCTKCHVLGKKETSSKCLECHVEIQNLTSIPKGYHGSSEVIGKQCHECHGEHFGRDFRVVVMDEEKFNHNLTGYRLEGKHREAGCKDCHKPELIMQRISQKTVGQTYLGLGTECISCHEDVHQKTLSMTCSSCHDQNSFSPAPLFDHSKTSFPLAGKHKTVNCALCHEKEIRNGKDFQRFAGTDHANCTSCHEDVHNNKFGSNCLKCHTENSFRDVRSISTFNHNQTDYPLTGMHVYVDCKKCHPNNLTQAIRHSLCTDCHEDEHKGQLARNGIATDCRRCHSTDGFTPSSYSLEDHNSSTFPLKGAHLSTACTECHKKSDSWNFSISGESCINCHDNIHGNKIQEKYFPQGNCTSCHSEKSWETIGFSHDKTNFRLLGRHQAVSCRDCHYRETDGSINQQFRGLAMDCENCHEDVHARQFMENGKNDCERCHAFENWFPVRFNHDKARFKLDGKHAGLQCIQCHQPTDRLIRNYIIYKFDDISCASCHS